MECSFFTKLVIYLLYSLQFYAAVFCTKNTEKFYHRPEFSGKVCHVDDTAFTETTPSRITCMDACSQSSTCKSVSYNTADFTCTGCTGIYNVSSNLLDRAENIFYESEYHVNECDSNPCQNGATCVNGQNSYTCTCASGWAGINCDQDVNECDSNPCQNGATCVNGQNSYTCTCASGWMGTNCEQDGNVCGSNPCQNGATCMNGQNSYTCTCASGWAGTNCEQGSCIESCEGRTNGNYQSCHGCEYYATCSWDAIFDKRPCPGGLVWDDNKKICDYESNTCP